MNFINKNSTNDFIKVVDLKYTEGGTFYWSFSKREAQLVLEMGGVCENKTQLVDYGAFSPIFKEHTKNWTFYQLILSSLTFLFNEKQITYVDWSSITGLLLNFGISNQILTFLQNKKKKKD